MEKPSPDLSTRSLDAPRRIGPYRIVRTLGRGGMGVVYLAEDDKLGRRVALKALTASLLPDEKARERFDREARAIARLKHRSIVPVYDVGEAEGQPFFVMELVEGMTLAQVATALRDLGQPAAGLEGAHLRGVIAGPDAADGDAALWRQSYVELISRWILEVADALAHAHGQGILHRDLKPSNVLVARDGAARLFDFGLARLSSELSLTQTGDFVGTPHYVAPEQVVGPHARSDERSDIYALGATLYELLTLNLPFQGETPHQVFRQILAKDPTPPSRLNAAVPRDLDTICLTCLEKDPARRYQDAAELAEDLRRFLSFRPVLAQPAGFITRSIRLVRRNRALSAAIVLGFVVVVIAPLLFALREQGSRAALAAEKQRVVEALARSEGLRLLAQSALVREENPGLALLLGLEGARRQPGVLANGTLLSALDVLREERVLAGPGRPLAGAAFDPTGTRVVSAGEDGVGRVWDVASGRVLVTLTGHVRGITCCRFAPNGRAIATAGEDSTVRMWSADDGREVAIFRKSGAPVPCVAISPDGQLLAAALDHLVFVWSPDRRQHHVLLQGHRGPVRSCEFSADGTRVVTAGTDGTARVFDVSSGRQLQSLDVPGDSVLHASFSPNGREIVTAAADHVARVFQVASGRESAALRGHLAWVTSAWFAPDGAHVVTASLDRTARVWNVETEREVAVLRGHEAGLGSAVFARDGKRVLTASDDGTARLWRTPEAGGEAKVWETPVTGGARSKPGADFGAKAMPGLPEAVRALGQSASDGRVFMLDADNAVGVTDPRAGFRRVATGVRGGTSRWISVRPDASGQRLVLVASDKIDVLDVARQASIGQVTAQGGTFRAAALAPDLRSVIVARDRQAVCLSLTTSLESASNVGNGRESAREPAREMVCFTGHDGTVLDVALSADGKLVATAGEDGVVLVSTIAGALRQRLTGHGGAVVSASFAADGTRLVTASRDGTVRVWEVASGKEVSVLPCHPVDTVRADFAADGRTVAILAGGGVVHKVPIDPVAEAIARKPRELTEPERRRYEVGVVTARP